MSTQIKAKYMCFLFLVSSSAFGCCGMAKHIEFHEQANKATELSFSFFHESRCPTTMTPRSWEHACKWTHTAIANACNGPAGSNADALRLFVNEFEQKVDRRASFETVCWVWCRVEELGPSGQNYVDKFWDDFLSGLSTSEQEYATKYREDWLASFC